MKYIKLTKKYDYNDSDGNEKQGNREIYIPESRIDKVVVQHFDDRHIIERSEGFLVLKSEGMKEGEIYNLDERECEEVLDTLLYKERD